MGSIIDEPTPVGCTADRAARGGDSDGDRERVSTLPRRRAGTRTRVSRTMTLEVAAREYVWLLQLRRGLGTRSIANREGVSIRRVRFGVARARAQEKSSSGQHILRPPRLIPLFPVGPYTPQSSCAHHQAIQWGSVLCCMVCHRSGMDEHPALQRDAVTEPAPEPVPSFGKISRETRRQRRQRLFGSRA